MEELRDNGTTILFVSHDAHLIERFCTTAIVMDHGNVVASGNTTAAMAFYQNLMLERSPAEVTDGVAPVETTYATGDVELIDVTLLDAQEQAKRIFQTHEAMTIRMRYRVVNAVPNAFVGISFWTEKDTRVGQAHSVFESPVPINLDGATEFFIDCVIAPLSLLPGTYYIRGGVYDKNIHFAYCLWGWTDRTIGLFSVDSSVVNGFVLKPSLGYVQFPSEWRTSLTDEQTL
jgi:lipopolysaccharide transport system ATP-binding protein